MSNAGELMAKNILDQTTGLQNVKFTAPTCFCRKSDAWRCARDQNLIDRVACNCPCHRRGV